MNILIIDNYDSFTFNLYQYVGEILSMKKEVFEVVVKRNDEIIIAEIQKANYDRIILSPGPGDPSDRKYFGVCADILTQISTTPILGVCLGMQGMAHYFGGKVVRAKIPMHGKISEIAHDGKGIFKGLPQDIEVMRYHSLMVDAESLPLCLEVTARVVNHESRIMNQGLDSRLRGNDKGEIMGLRHKTLPIEGIQFHPESFATEGGKKMLENFLF